MNFRLAALAVLFATPAFAHPGHTGLVDGHTHSLTDLMIMGALTALVIIGGIAFALTRAKRRND